MNASVLFAPGRFFDALIIHMVRGYEAASRRATHAAA